MKHFSLSTILGLVFGVFLAGYAVFAFQAPTQAPPAGNVPAPLNTGPSDQTKTGGLLQVFGLWVNQALGVSGGATFGGALNLQGNRITNVGSPSATGDAATKEYVDSKSGGHISGGLYGICRQNQFSGGSHCRDAIWPAFCVGSGNRESCECPGDYTLVRTGTEPWSGATANYLSCYKR